MPWKNRASIGLFGSAILVFIAIGFLSFNTSRKFVSLSVGNQKAYKNLLSLESTLSTMKDIETGQRGYVLSGDTTYLEPYNSGSLAIADRIKTLKQGLADDPRQLLRLKTLENVIKKRVFFARELIKRVESKGSTTVRNEVPSTKGKTYMDEIRFIIADMIEQEQSKVTRYDTLTLDTASTLLLTLIFLVLLDIVLIVIGVIIVNRDIVRKRTRLINSVEARANELSASESGDEEDLVRQIEASRILRDVVSSLKDDKMPI